MNLVGTTSDRFAKVAHPLGAAARSVGALLSTSGFPALGKPPAGAPRRESTTAIFRFAQRAVKAILGPVPGTAAQDRIFVARVDWSRVLESACADPSWTYDRAQALLATPEGPSALRQKFSDLDRDFKKVREVPVSVPGARYPSLERARDHLTKAAARWERIMDALAARDLPCAASAMLGRFEELARVGPCVSEYERRPLVTAGGFVAKEALERYVGAPPRSPEAACVRRLCDAGLAPKDAASVASLERALVLGSYYTAFLALQKRSLAACDAALARAFPPLHRGWAFRHFRHLRASDAEYGKAVERARDPFWVDPSPNPSADGAVLEAETPLKTFERSALSALGFEAGLAAALVDEARKDELAGLSAPMGN